MGTSPELPTWPQAGGRSRPSSWKCPHVTSSEVTLNPGGTSRAHSFPEPPGSASRTHGRLPRLGPREALTVILLGVIFPGRDGGYVSHTAGEESCESSDEKATVLTGRSFLLSLCRVCRALRMLEEPQKVSADPAKFPESHIFIDCFNHPPFFSSLFF